MAAKKRKSQRKTGTTRARKEARSQEDELKTLESRFWLVLCYLVIVLIGCLYGIARMFFDYGSAMNQWQLTVLCILGGALGGSSAATLSVAQRRANGWALASGMKIPESSRKERFNASMMPFFIVRPVFSAAMGFLAYVGIGGGFLIAARETAIDDLTPEGLVFFSVLAGLFAKTFLERLKRAFKAFVGEA